MGQPTRKYLIFDLDSKELKRLFGEKNYTYGYTLLRRALERNGFEWQQGSGYLSAKPISRPDMASFYRAMADEMPWLDSCSNAIHFADVHGFYDLKALAATHKATISFPDQQLELADFDNAFPTIGEKSFDYKAQADPAYRKYITFDLDTKELKKVLGETRFTSAYKDIESFLKENDYNHKQGSGYLSNQSLTVLDAVMLYKAIEEKFPWAVSSIRTMHYADVNHTYDLKKWAEINFKRNHVEKENENWVKAHSRKFKNTRDNNHGKVVQFSPRQNDKEATTSNRTSLASKAKKCVAMSNALNRTAESRSYRSEAVR